jgi:uncharacterized membrane protein required for colicin V production
MDFLGRLTSGDYVDIVCAGLVLICVGVGLRRGISGELSRLLGLILGAAAGYWIYVPGAETMAGMDFLKSNPQFASLIAFCVALLAGLVCFLLLTYLFTHIIKIVLDPIWDRSLGLIAGLLNAAILLSVVFTLAMILPDPSQRALLCEQSRAGRFATPYLTRFLHTPHPTTTHEQDASEGSETTKQTKPAAPVAAQPTAKPAPKATVRASTKSASATTVKTAATAKPRASVRPAARPAARTAATNALVHTTTHPTGQ